MVILHNNMIYITKDDPSYYPFYVNFCFEDSGNKTIFRKRKNGSVYSIRVPYKNVDRIYELDDNGNMILPSGLLSFLEKYFVNSNVIDKRHKTILSTYDFSSLNMKNYRNCLDIFPLRNEQLLCVKKMLFSRNCIIQSPTGSGKTAMMACFIKILKDINNGSIPTTLLFEPTVYLVNSMIKTFESYGIKCSNYRDNREIVENVVNICHPASVNNDLESYMNLIENVKVMLYDECHHLQSLQFSKSSRNAYVAEYNIGMSASVISQDNVNKDNIFEYSPSEIKIIGSTGKVVMNILPKYQIDKEYLATPVLIVMNNSANEYVEQVNNWHEVVSNVLQSEERTRITCETSKLFASKKRKVLILVNTKKWARILMNKFDELGISSEVCSSYGSGQFERIKNGEFENCSNEDIINKFENGNVNILIGTSHLYEGADIQNLDVIVLAFGGKKARMHLQGIGRALRKSKNGKYAYIIDFSDHENVVLRKQFRYRYQRYEEMFGIPEDRIFKDVETDELDGIFNNLENN